MALRTRAKLRCPWRFYAESRVKGTRGATLRTNSGLHARACEERRPNVPKTLERDIEKYFVAEVQRLGGEVRKLKWIGRANAPDRVVLLHGVYFVELKRPGEKPRPAQAREFARMACQGVPVHVLSTFDEVNEFVKRILKL